MIGNDVTFQGAGTGLLRSKIRTKVRISGSGKLNGMDAKGRFQIEIEHPKFPDDQGTWSMSRI
ncbi:MAG: hypothetical protein V6Z89_16410 [Desulfobacter sp.]